MGKLKEAIDAYNAQKKERLAPDVLAIMNQSVEELKALGIEQRALRTGDTMPDFTLPNQLGEPRSLSGYLARSPIVLNIYRGSWCPYCNLEMKALIDALREFQARGVNLVAMAPELPDRSLEFAESNHLSIDILSDTCNRISEQLGLVFELPQALRPIYEKSGTYLPTFNGNGTFKLPVPATYIIDRNAKIVFDFVNADYRMRFEPTELVAKLDQLKLS